MKTIVGLSQDLSNYNQSDTSKDVEGFNFNPYSTRALSGQILLGQALWNLRGKKTWTSLSQRPYAVGSISEVGSEEEEKIKEIYKELGLQVLAAFQKS